MTTKPHAAVWPVNMHQGIKGYILSKWQEIGPNGLRPNLIKSVETVATGEYLITPEYPLEADAKKRALEVFEGSKFDKQVLSIILPDDVLVRYGYPPRLQAPTVASVEKELANGQAEWEAERALMEKRIAELEAALHASQDGALNVTEQFWDETARCQKLTAERDSYKEQLGLLADEKTAMRREHEQMLARLDELKLGRAQAETERDSLRDNAARFEQARMLWQIAQTLFAPEATAPAVAAPYHPTPGQVELVGPHIMPKGFNLPTRNEAGKQP